jgi:hypothetical protein
MAIVVSGRDAVTNTILARQDELDVLLAAPESGVACRQTNSKGRTPLMLAAYYAGTDSTDAVVACEPRALIHLRR